MGKSCSEDINGGMFFQHTVGYRSVKILIYAQRMVGRRDESASNVFDALLLVMDGIESERFCW